MNQLYFTNWNLRGSFLSTDEMRAGLGIAKGNFNKQGISENMVLDFCQYDANINMRAIMTIEKCPAAYIPDTSYFKTVVDNISLLLDRLGAHFLTDSKTREVCIAYNDELSLVVGVDFPEIESSLAEYLKIDMDFAVYFYPQFTFVFPMPRMDGPLCPPIRKSLAGQRAGIEPGPYKISGNTMPNWEYFHMTAA